MDGNAVEDGGNNLQEEFWDDVTEEEINRDLNENDVEDADDGSDKANSIVNWILSSLMCIQTKFNFSDKCLAVLLLLFKQLFLVLGAVNTLCFAISALFPASVYLYRKYLQFDRDDFTKLIVCPHCSSVYRFEQVVREIDGTTRVLKCSNRLFGCRLPKNNKNKGKRGKYQCNADLVLKIRLKNNAEKYYPLKIFCYK